MAGETETITAEQSGTFETPAPRTRANETPAHTENSGSMSEMAHQATTHADRVGTPEAHAHAAMAHGVAMDHALDTGNDALASRHSAERERHLGVPGVRELVDPPEAPKSPPRLGPTEEQAAEFRRKKQAEHQSVYDKARRDFGLPPRLLGDGPTANVFPAGTQVRVNAPGHAAHGKTGVMTGTSPEFGVYHVRAEGAVHAVPAHGLEPVDRRELSKPVGIAGAQSHTEAVTASGPAVQTPAAVKNSGPPPAVTSQPSRRPPEGAGLGRKPWLGLVPGNRDSKPLTRQEPLMAGLSGATPGGDTFGAGGRFDLTTPGSGDGEHAAALMDKGDYAGAAAKFRSAAAYHSTMAGQCDDAQAAATAGAVAGDRNGMTGNARRTTVDYLIANGCGCWGEEDRPLLMGFSAERLKSLEANAQGRADEAAVLNALRGEGLSVNGVVVQLAADGTVVGDYRAADGSRPALAELVRNYGTPEEREAWEAAIALTAGERQRLVDSLTANSMPSRRDAAAAAYGKMTMPELRELVASLPPRQPVPGGRGAAPDGRGVRVVPPAALPAPNNSAAGVGPGVVVNAAAGADRRDAPLALPRLKFDNPMESRKRS